MTRGRRDHTNILSAAVFILLEVAAICIMRSTVSLQSIWLNKASNQVKTWIWGKSSNIKNYFALSEKNKALEEENALLWDELRKYRELEKAGKVPPLNSLDDNFTCMLAKVLKLSTNQQNNYFIIDKGAEEGVEPHSGIVTPLGIVGIVDIVNRNYSFGRTLMNPGISISARLGSSGVSGTLVWDGVHNNMAILHGIPLYYDIPLKDTVKTSGYSSVFPSDIALGTVKDTRIRGGSSKDIIVELFQDFSTLDYVYVIKNTHLDEVEELEKQEASL